MKVWSDANAVTTVDVGGQATTLTNRSRMGRARSIFGLLLAGIVSSAHGTLVTFTNVDLNSAGAISKGGLQITPTASNGGSIGPTYPEFPYYGMWVGRAPTASNGTYSFTFDRPVTSIELSFNALTYTYTERKISDTETFVRVSNETIGGFASGTGATVSPITIDLLSPSQASYANGIISTTGIDGRGVISYKSSVPFDSLIFSHTKSSIVNGQPFNEINGDGFLIGRVSVDYVPAIYGIFVGLDSPAKFGLRLAGKDDAQAMATAFSSLPGFRDPPTLLLGDTETGGISLEVIQAAVDDIKAKLRPGDKFIFYGSGHGGSLDTGLETTSTPGNDYFENTEDGVYLTDTILTEMLRGMGDSVEKWVLLDSCRSGGFWGDSNPDDKDLDSLSNVALFAASKEDSNGQANPFTGRGYFTSILTAALEYNSLLGRRLADTDADGNISYSELSIFANIFKGVSYSSEALEKDRGDLIAFSPEMYAPVSFASNDFQGSFNGSILPRENTVPESPVYLLAITSLAGLIHSRRARRVRGQVQVLSIRVDHEAIRNFGPCKAATAPRAT